MPRSARSRIARRPFCPTANSRATVIRVPFILSWPGGLPAGVVHGEPVISLDLLATFTAAAGRPATEDSANLLPYLREERGGRPHDHLYWRSGPTAAIRDGRWKLIRCRRADLTAEGIDWNCVLGHPGTARPRRPRPHRLAPPPGGWTADTPLGHVTMLYDPDADPGETANPARRHPGVVERLTARYDERAATLPANPAVRPARGLRFT